MESAPAASDGGQAGAELPMEPLGSRDPGQKQPQGSAEETGWPESPESSPCLTRAVKEAAGAGRDLSEEKQLPPPRLALPRVPTPSLGYGAFRRQGSTSPEQPSPGPVVAEQPGDGEASGSELVPSGASGTWAPMELQVDVRVKPVGTAGGSRSPSPAPSTRFLTVRVPESPAFPRHASASHPLLSRTPSPGSTWVRGAPYPAAWAERSRNAEGGASPAEGLAGSPGSPAGCCRCQELGLGKEGAALLPGAEIGGERKLSRAITLIGLPMYMKSLRWALAVMAVLLAVSAVTIVVLASRVGGSCRPCPKDWMWSEEYCFYLPVEAQTWEASQAFCSAHHATLPLLSHMQDFLSRNQVTKYTWVGARRGSQGWHWIDGAPCHPSYFQRKTRTSQI